MLMAKKVMKKFAWKKGEFPCNPDTIRDRDSNPRENIYDQQQCHLAVLDSTITSADSLRTIFAYGRWVVASLSLVKVELACLWNAALAFANAQWSSDSWLFQNLSCFRILVISESWLFQNLGSFRIFFKEKFLDCTWMLKDHERSF